MIRGLQWKDYKQVISYLLEIVFEMASALRKVFNSDQSDEQPHLKPILKKIHDNTSSFYKTSL